MSDIRETDAQKLAKSQRRATFGEAWGSYFYCTLSGRSSRAEFVWVSWPLLLWGVIGWLSVCRIVDISNADVYAAISRILFAIWVFYLLLLGFFISRSHQKVRQLYDRGHSRVLFQIYFISFLFPFLIGLIDAHAPVAVIFSGIFSLIWLNLGLILGFCLTVRRLHDIGWSGFIILLFLVPLVNLVLLAIVFCRKSDPKTNKYGSIPWLTLVPEDNFNPSVDARESFRQEEFQRQEATPLSGAAAMAELLHKSAANQESHRRAQADLRHLEELRLQEEAQRQEAEQREAEAAAETVRQEELLRQEELRRQEEFQRQANVPLVTRVQSDCSKNAEITPTNEEKRITLFVREGPFMGKRFVLPATGATIGRDAVADICIDDESLSRLHCRLVYDGNALILRDLGSLNGTMVNDQYLDGRSSSKIIVPGDTITLGNTLLVMEETAEMPEPAEAFNVSHGNEEAVDIKDEVPEENRADDAETVRQEELRRQEAEQREAEAATETVRQEELLRQEVVRREAEAKAEAVRQAAEKAEALRQEEIRRQEAKPDKSIPNKTDSGIYYLHDYIPTKSISTENERAESQKILDYKNCKENAFRSFTDEIKRAILTFKGEQIGLVAVPTSGVNKVSPIQKSIAIIVKLYNEGKIKNCDKKIIDFGSLLERISDVPSSHLCSPSDRPSYDKHYKSIRCNSENLSKDGITFILLDDITTKGTIMDVCKDILIAHGANEQDIIRMVVARTVSVWRRRF